MFWMEIYLEEHLLSNRAEAVAARVFIQRQLPGAEAHAQQAEAVLRDFLKNATTLWNWRKKPA